MIVDTHTFIGEYPFRHLETPTAEFLVREMDRVGIDRAWVSYLPSAFHRDPALGTATLNRTVKPFVDRLDPVPTVHPGMPRWEDDLNFASVTGAAAVAVYPTQQALSPDGGEMRVLVAACAALRLPIIWTVRFEDGRQRHPRDVSEDLPAASVRGLIRSDPDAKFVVRAAGTEFIQEVHFGLTTEEAARLIWDISWIAGPPGDHLKQLVDTIGYDRFVFGTGMPLRIPDGTVAKLDLLAPGDDERAAIESGNLTKWRDH